jgi:pilus assembly protein CpaF
MLNAMHEPMRDPGKGSLASEQIRERVQRRLLAELSPTIDTRNVDQVRPTLEQIFLETLTQEQLPLSRMERTQLFDEIVADILGFGVLEPLLRDDSVTEILVNGPDQVFIERNGLLKESDVRFRDNAELMRIIDRIVAPWAAAWTRPARW